MLGIPGYTRDEFTPLWYVFLAVIKLMCVDFEGPPFDI